MAAKLCSGRYVTDVTLLHHKSIGSSRYALVSPNKHFETNNSFQEGCYFDISRIEGVLPKSDEHSHFSRLLNPCMFPNDSEEFFHSWLLWNFKWSTNKVRNSNRTSKNILKVDSVHIVSPRPMISSCTNSVQELELDKTVIFVYYSAKIIVFDVINCIVFPRLNSWWWNWA